MSVSDDSAAHSFDVSRIAIISFVLVMALLPLVLWYRSTGDLGYYLQPQSPPGQLIYVLAKLFGLYAAFFLMMQMAYGLLAKMNILHVRKFWMIKIHLGLAALIVLCALLHVVSFVAAKTIRNSAMDWSIFLPLFNHGYYRSSLSLGLIAIVTLIITLLGGRRLLRTPRSTRTLHYFSYLTVFLVLSHALLVGSEARTMLMGSAYWLFGLVLLATLVWRQFRRRPRKQIETRKQPRT